MRMVLFRWVLSLIFGVFAGISLVAPSIAGEVSQDSSSETLEEIDKQLESNPLSEVLILRKCSILYKRKDSRAVIATVKPLLASNPKNVSALKATGLSYYRLKEYGMANEFLSRLIELEPTYDSILVRGFCRARVGLYKEAFEDNDWCVRLHPNDGRTYIERADIRRCQVGSLDAECESYLKKAIELSPNDCLVQQDFTNAMKQLEYSRKIIREYSE